MATYQSKFTGKEIDAKLDQVGQVASADVLGGIKVGEGLEITEDGILSALGGGSGGISSQTVLWQGELKTENATVTISDSIKNYDFILVETCIVASGIKGTISTSLLDVETIRNSSENAFNIYNSAGTSHWYRVLYGFVDDMTLKLIKATVSSTVWSLPQISKVIGIKLGGGNSSSVREYGTFISNGTTVTTGQTFTLNEESEDYGVISTGTSFNTISKDSSGNPILKAGKTYKISVSPVGFGFSASNGSFVAHVNMGETNVYLCNIMSASLTSHSTNLVLNDFYYKPTEDVSLIVKEGHPTHADSKSTGVTSYRFRIFVEEM